MWLAAAFYIKECATDLYFFMLQQPAPPEESFAWKPPPRTESANSLPTYTPLDLSSDSVFQHSPASSTAALSVSSSGRSDLPYSQHMNGDSTGDDSRLPPTQSPYVTLLQKSRGNLVTVIQLLVVDTACLFVSFHCMFVSTYINMLLLCSFVSLSHYSINIYVTLPAEDVLHVLFMYLCRLHKKLFLFKIPTLSCVRTC